MDGELTVERLTIAFTGFCCVYYGLYGLAVIASTDSCQQSEVLSTDAKNKVAYTPVTGSFKCSVALVVGYALLRVNRRLGEAFQKVTLKASQIRTTSNGGNDIFQQAIRFFVLVLVMTGTIYSVRRIVLNPLLVGNCTNKDSEKYPLIFSFRSTLETLETYVLTATLIVVVSYLLWLVVDGFSVEHHVKKIDPNKLHQGTNQWGVQDIHRPRRHHGASDTSSSVEESESSPIRKFEVEKLEPPNEPPNEPRIELDVNSNPDTFESAHG
jgi:hypothetical protein